MCVLFLLVEWSRVCCADSNGEILEGLESIGENEDILDKIERMKMYRTKSRENEDIFDRIEGIV